MYQYLKDHAVKNVWCNPDQDNQLIIAAQRITKALGVFNQFTLMNRKIKLPVSAKRFHVFQVGQIHPKMVGLLGTTPDWKSEAWVKFSDAINIAKVFVNIYTAKGAILPAFKAYYMFSNERDLIFAIELDRNIPLNYDTEKVYVRLYSNAYFQSVRGDSTENYLHCKGLNVSNVEEILALQTEYLAYQSKPGHVYAHCNGYLINAIGPLTVKIGDTVEYVYDSSVKRVVTFTVKDVSTFTSILDSKFKYLLHHLNGSDDTIDYQDDIDIHIVHRDSQGKEKGFYFHRNAVDSHRMVTHRDYSIAVEYFHYIATALSDSLGGAPLDLQELKLQVKIRNSGYHRPLIHDNNRIFELYKLPDAQILQAMVGLNANVAVWKAENLENSAYTRMMREGYQGITIEHIQEGYGYNSLSKLLGDTPAKTTLRSGRQSADLPFGLYESSTVYEYDASGRLLEYHYHPVGTDYEAVNGNARLVEAISGQGTYRPDVKFGTDNIDLPTLHNYRVYMCYYVNGLPNNVWRDITKTDLYQVVNNKLVWSGFEYGQFLMVRTDKTFLAYELDLLPVNGNLFFTLAEEEDRGSGQYLPTTLPVPLGELDILLNGNSLIRNLDYFVKFPMVHIVNKTHLLQPFDTAAQKVHIRFTGFADATLAMDAIEEFGFVEHGFLSNNKKHDIRDDKVLRITLNGAIKHRDDLLFSEQHSGISVVNTVNGHPYQIKDIVVPLKGLVQENTYSMRAKSMVIDTAVSNYMTLKLPQPARNAVSSIYQRYAIVSPFFSGLIHALLVGYINIGTISRTLSDIEVLDICRPYEELLEFDPISEHNRLDSRYVVVHLHRYNMPVDVKIAQYKFLTRAVKLYGNGLVELSSLTFTT